MIHIKRFVMIAIGVLLLPAMYARYSCFFYLWLIPYDVGAFLFAWFFHALIFGFIMGNVDLMDGYTKLIQRIFNIKYNVIGYWTTDMLHSHSVWRHPILKVRDASYHLSIAISGGGLYEERANIRRKAIIYWFIYY